MLRNIVNWWGECANDHRAHPGITSEPGKCAAYLAIEGRSFAPALCLWLERDEIR
jgi:hypothetical protein